MGDILTQYVTQYVQGEKEEKGGNGSSSPMFSGLITENDLCQPKNIAM